MVVGVGGGVGAAFAKSQLRTTYSTATRLERATGLPFIGAIREIVTAPQKELRRRKLRLFAGAGGALAGVFLVRVLVEVIQRGKIGSAACRERGCQYVLSAVVAVSFRNKRSTKVIIV